MGLLDRLLGRNSDQDKGSQAPSNRRSGMDARSAMTDDEQAVERFRYLLRTAPPDAIEQAHEEAFARLTPDQRQLVLQGLSVDLPAHERSDRDDPRSLARMATRAEVRRPGTLERTFGGMNPGGGGIGLGGLMAGSFLSSIAGVVIGTAVADAIFNDGSYDQGYSDGEAAADSGESGDGSGGSADFSGGDTFGSDFGGDFGGGEF